MVHHSKFFYILAPRSLNQSTKINVYFFFFRTRSGPPPDEGDYIQCAQQIIPFLHFLMAI